MATEPLVGQTPGPGEPGFAPAKVNLALHVTGRRDDGYHLLDSLVVFADIGDRLTYDPGAPVGIALGGPMAAAVPAGADNLVLRAAHATGAGGGFALDKRLPAAAGLGGGSSDAAAALRLLQAAGHTIPEALETLGADIPACLVARALRMRGIGERLEPVALPPLPAVLVNPGVGLSTGAVFSGLARRDNPGLEMPMPEGQDADSWIAWLARQRNDLEAPAVAICADVAAVLAALRTEPGARLVRMSGSGASCFALFGNLDEAQDAATRLQQAHPGWWVRPTLLS